MFQLKLVTAWCKCYHKKYNIAVHSVLISLQLFSVMTCIVGERLGLGARVFPVTYDIAFDVANDQPTYHMSIV